jgi:CO/xanthine dehydrogenase FAD-binding subunit
VSRTFFAPTTVDEALVALAAGSRPVAGGTDLVVGARQGKAPLPERLLAIHRIEALGGIEVSGDHLRLGTLVTHRQIVDHPVVRARFTAIADASAIVGSHATRAQGTIGGNVMNASPAMDTGGPLLCFGATVTLRSTGGERVLALDDLWLGPGRTAATPDELLVAIDLALPGDGSGSCYVRLEYRRQMEIAVVGATAVVKLDGGAVSDARVAITALSATIRRVPEAERALIGSDGGPDAVEAAARAVSAGSSPISDVRGSADYRSAMAGVIARRAITGALDRAQGVPVPIPASPALHGEPRRQA